MIVKHMTSTYGIVLHIQHKYNSQQQQQQQQQQQEQEHHHHHQGTCHI